MTNRHIDGFREGTPVPSVIGYTVRLTNSFTVPLPTVHVQIKRKRRAPYILSVGPLAPGARFAVPVGTIDDLEAYNVSVYDLEGRAIAMLPLTGAPITPADAAAAQPSRVNPHTDDWTLDPSLMLDMTATYTVRIINKTPDTWDEVLLQVDS